MKSIVYNRILAELESSMEGTQELKETGVVAEATPLIEETEETVNAAPVFPAVEETHTPNAQEENDASTSSKISPSSTRRPLTRSQTGTVTKRRRRDDSDSIGENKKRTPAPRKRQKASSTPVGDNAGPPPLGSSSTSSPKPAPTREVSLASTTSTGVLPSNGNQITFYHTSSTSDDQAECRLPRSRATLPTPIPNLTKKSRGRRVPTQDSAVNDPDKKDHRLYVCTVDGCGKCFHRGEHLKRHIRSIHTHEKPFKCTYPLCQKYFNRHDNLLQHLKVHRENIPKEAADETQAPNIPQRQSESRSSSASPPAYRRQRSYTPIDEPESPVAPAIPRTIYNAFPKTTTYGAYPSSTAFSAATSSISLLADMAVSSLRTELPQSPVDTRGNALRSNPF